MAKEFEFVKPPLPLPGVQAGGEVSRPFLDRLGRFLAHSLFGSFGSSFLLIVGGVIALGILSPGLLVLILKGVGRALAAVAEALAELVKWFMKSTEKGTPAAP